MSLHQTLTEANKARYLEKTLIGLDWPLAMWIVKLSEECGEVAAALTKSRGRDNLAEELADVTIVANLIATVSGINLDEVVRKKFNDKSEKAGSRVRIYEDYQK